MPKSVVIDPAFDWRGDRPPGTPLHQSIIYEVHVKGFTQLCRDVPPELRGTYAGLGSAGAIEYLQTTRGDGGRIVAGARAHRRQDSSSIEA